MGGLYNNSMMRSGKHTIQLRGGVYREYEGIHIVVTEQPLSFTTNIIL